MTQHLSFKDIVKDKNFVLDSEFSDNLQCLLCSVQLNLYVLIFKLFPSLYLSLLRNSLQSSKYPFACIFPVLLTFGAVVNE